MSHSRYPPSSSHHHHHHRQPIPHQSHYHQQAPPPQQQQQQSYHHNHHNNNNNLNHYHSSNQYEIAAPSNYPQYNQYQESQEQESSHYGGHRGSDQSTSNNRYNPYYRDRDRDRDRHRDGRDRRDRSRERYGKRNDRYDGNERNDRYHNNNRNNNDRGQRYNNNNNNRNDRYYGGGQRGGFNGGYNNNNNRFNGGGQRGGFNKEKYEITSIHKALLESIKELSLDQRGAQPLRKWIDKQTNTEYMESRFKKDTAKMTKLNGQILSQSKPVKIREIPQNAVVKMDKNSDIWLEGIPKNGGNNMILTFKNSVNVTTNSIKIDDESIKCHQYTFDIYNNNDNNTEKKENSNNSNNNNNNNDVIMDIDNIKPDLSESDRRDIYMKIRRPLKVIYPSNFDNMHIFSFKSNPPSDPIINIQQKQFPQYVISLERQYSTDGLLDCNSDRQKKQQSFHEIYGRCSPQFREQGYSILNRQRFFAANYTKIDRKEDKYYSLRNLDDMEVWKQNGTDLAAPDLRLLCGYKSTVVHSGHCITKTQLATKLITKHSIYDLIEANGIDAVNIFIKGKRAITSYSNQIVVLHGLDATKNMDSTFKLNNGKTITFREYYMNKKDQINNGRKVQLLEKQERALIIHKKLNEQILYYLPQLLYVIVPVEVHLDHTKKALRKRSHPNVQTIIKKAIEINTKLNTINKTAPFRTESKPITTKGYYIESPLICFKTQRGIQRYPATDFNGRSWSNVNGFWSSIKSLKASMNNNNNNNNNGGNMRNIVGIDWAICYDGNSRNGRECASKFQGLVKTFNNKRRFEYQPLNTPDVLEMDYNQLPQIRHKLRGSRYKVILFILPNHGNWKTDITRHVLFGQEPSTALSTPNASPIKGKHRQNDKRSNNISMDLQFIQERTVGKMNAVFNVIETLFLKSKLILYYLEPQLPSNVFNYHRLWMIGIKILRKKGGAHLLVINLNRAPMVGTIKYLTNHSQMISSEKDVIPQRMMQELTKDLLKCAINKIITSNGDESLPLNIIILRSSGGDGLLKQIISKEVAGFKKTLSEFVKTEKNLIRRANGGSSKWYPGVIFSVLQENVPDAFGIGDTRNNMNILDSPKALVVNQAITSSQYMDVFISLPTKQERQLYGRVIRLVTLTDDYNTGNNENARPHSKDRLRASPKLFSDYISIIYSSIWSYALNIPFPKVPNYPGPIKFAEHYASWQWSVLTDNDTNLSDLVIDVDNAKPRICQIIPQSSYTKNNNNNNNNNNNDNDVVMEK